MPEKTAEEIREEQKKIAADIIGQADYARLRLNPERGHNFYLHLRDLLTALKEIAHLPHGTLLDFGCGAAPYRSLFPHVTYRRADYTPSGDLDYVVGEDQTISAADASFDTILSTQVLEHLRVPSVYLSECFRLLKPGGILLLSTHGLFEEHGCPFDFRRWTAEGLKIELIEAGFQLLQLKKLTTGPRAAGFLFRQYGGLLAPGRRSLAGLLHWALFRRTTRFFAKLDARLDRDCATFGVVDADEPGHILYIALLAVARRPV